VIGAHVQLRPEQLVGQRRRDQLLPLELRRQLEHGRHQHESAGQRQAAHVWAIGHLRRHVDGLGRPQRDGNGDEGRHGRGNATAAECSADRELCVTCSGLTCSFNGSASSDTDGSIAAYAWNFGDGSGEGGNAATTIQHTYFQSGTYTAGLTVTDNGGAANTQWQTITVKGSNAAPTAAFTFSCAGLTCSFDGSGSADPDGTIAAYSWAFGDSTSGSGKTATHAYAGPGGYAVTLTVTDHGGATASVSKAVATISLSARGYKQNGLEKADLSWTGASGATFDIYRNGVRIATVQAIAYTDNINNKGAGSYTYKVCEVASVTCSNKATVSF
jgi:PKD repeat protein